MCEYVFESFTPIGVLLCDRVREWANYSDPWGFNSPIPRLWTGAFNSLEQAVAHCQGHQKVHNLLRTVRRGDFDRGHEY